MIKFWWEKFTYKSVRCILFLERALHLNFNIEQILNLKTEFYLIFVIVFFYKFHRDLIRKGDG